MSKKNKRPAGTESNANPNANARANDQRGSNERHAPSGSADAQARQREKNERDPFADNGEFDAMAEAERQESQNSTRQW